jgi:hypothetical protein
VSVWYPQGSNRANNAPHQVAHMGGTTTYNVNQQINGGQWVVLGTHSFGATGTVTINCVGANPSVVMADAIRLSWVAPNPTPTPTASPSPSPSPSISPSPSPTPAPLILDNNQAGVTYSGTWTVATSATNKYGSDYRYASSGTTAEATYSFTLPAPGQYSVAVWYPNGSNRANNAPHRVDHATGATTYNVNQQINGGQWVVLGTHTFGTTGAVVIRCTGANPSVVMADAIRLSWVGP